MKTHVIRTKDSLEYRITEAEALQMGKLLDSGQAVVINGNRITNADQPQIRKLTEAPRSLLQLAEGTFTEKSPRWHYLRDWIQYHGSRFIDKGMPVYTSLLDYVGPQVDWNAEEAAKFIEGDYEALQEHNTPKEFVRPDRSANAPFDPANHSGKNCGKCMDGWLPGNDGLIMCRCNPKYATE